MKNEESNFFNIICANIPAYGAEPPTFGTLAKRQIQKFPIPYLYVW